VALIVVTKTADDLLVRGDARFSRSLDPWIDASGRVGYSLEAGWRWTDTGLEVFADRLGAIPIFYAIGDGRLVLSDSISSLVAEISPEWNFDALAVFLRIGFFLGQHTPIAGVSTLARGTRATVTATSFHLPHEIPLPVPSHNTIGRLEACEHYAELFREAVGSRRLDGRIGLPLSGGRDSRHILFELMRAGRPPDVALTYSAMTNDPEYEVAVQMCRELGVPHVHAPDRVRSEVARELEKNRRTHHLTDEHAWYLQVVASLHDQQVDGIFDGIGGDVLSNGLFYDPKLMEAFVANRPDEVARLLLGEREVLPYLPETWQTRLSWERAMATVAHEAARHARQPNPLASFFFWNRTCREIALAPFCLARDFQVATPYLHPPLLEFLLSLPANEFGAPGFHDETIRRAFSMQAHIPYASAKEGLSAQRIRPKAVDQAAIVGYYWRAVRRGVIKPVFAAKRLARALCTQDIRNDGWWLQRMLYLLGLSDLSGLGFAPKGS
jgi:asparagine synthase (glutamine-hydrolysing)